ncbi:MAG TPA: hypothetical protein PKG79_12260, partial [Propioniciclava tarda]|nr:hypothetical protein [Propioniciclava tarda]HQD61941.1 hypothetical protein [Propioniciclava tarda]
GIAGADLTTYQQCYDTKAPKPFLDAVSKAYYNSGVRGTPTFVRNGAQLPIQPVDDTKNKIPATTVDQFKSLILTGK